MNRLTAPLIGFLAELKRSPLLMLLCAIILLGFGLRVWGINFGLPYIYHPDEGFEVNRALQLASGSFDFSRVAKGGYFYVIFVEFGFLFVFMKLFGAISSTKEFAMLYISDPSYFYLMGRFTTATIGAICIALTYRLGARTFSPVAGLIAALFLCLNILHVQHSHYITVDIPLTCLCLASLLFILNIGEGKGGKNYIWAATFIALASMTKIPGMVLLVPFFVAHLVRASQMRRSVLPAVFAKEWIGAFCIFLLVYVIGNPGIIVHFKAVVMNMVGLYGVSPGSGAEEAVLEGAEAAAAAIEFNPVEFYLTGTWNSMGGVPFILGFLGMALIVIQKNMKGILLLMFMGIFFLGLILAVDMQMAYARYVLPYLPIWLICSAGGLVWLINLAVKKIPVPVGFAAFCMAAALSLPILSESLENTDQILRIDSRTEAKLWIDENLPENSRILIEGMTAQTYKLTVPLVNSVENTKNSIKLFKEYEEFGKAKYFELELEAKKDKRYDLVYYLWDNLEPLEEYKNKQVEYIVLRPTGLNRTVKYIGVGPQFVKSILEDPEFKLIKTFKGEEDGGNGPMIEIYQRVKS